MSLDWVIGANSLSAKLLRPDLNIYIDVSPDISITRINHGRNSTELYETKENLHQVREKYMEAFEKLRSEEAIYITDGNRSAELIAKDIWQEVSKKMEWQDSFQ
jgi:dTMP kinase